MLSYKDCIVLLNNRSEFLGLQEEQLKYRTLNLVRSRSPLPNSPDFINFIALQSVLNSDGFPRYVYFGDLTITQDASSQVSLNYRGFAAYSITASEHFLTKDLTIFDSIIQGLLTQEGNMQFYGFIIDRGA